MTRNNDVAVQAVKKKFGELVQQAIDIYPQHRTALQNITLCTTLTGTKAGEAREKTRQGVRFFTLRVNVAMMTINDTNWDGILNNTVSHELAHIIDFMIRGKSNHDRYWVAIHRRLGGNGKACHNYECRFRGGSFVYHVNGTDVILSKVRHERLTKGSASYSFLIAGERVKIKPDMFVGVRD
jgi:predicted SprT family Zn-dependent metalloprotease